VLIPDSYLVKEWLEKKNSNNHEVYYEDFEDTTVKYKYFNYFNDAAAVLAKWRNLKTKLSQVEKQYYLKVDIVFFSWLDTFLANYLPGRIIEWIFPYKWSGLYFHPRHLRLQPEYLQRSPKISDIDHVLTARNCISIAIHDEGISNDFQKRLKGKPVVCFPEIADNTPPNPHNALAKSIKGAADGRTVVGIIGLDRHKGTMTLLRLAKIAPQNDFFFVFAGRINYQFYTLEEQQALKELFNNPPKNCFIHLHPLMEGEEFNSLFFTFDIPFIVYNNFPSTSNNLTKASLFRKPVIATNRFCIGEDVKKFGLGVTVSEGDIHECLLGLHDLRDKIKSGSFPDMNFCIYAERQSEKKMPAKFQEVLLKR
jgi:hypothetical protein